MKLATECNRMKYGHNNLAYFCCSVDKEEEKFYVLTPWPISLNFFGVIYALSGVT